MMLPAPRIIAIDDEQKHLDGLADGLNQYGVACLKVPFTAGGIELKDCPYVRVIFADLHLTEGSSGDDNKKHYGVIGGLIEETIRPMGPYLVILWTRFAHTADELRQFLMGRLEGVAKPFHVGSLDKNVHLNEDGLVKDVDGLMKDVMEIVNAQGQIAALLNWEERMLGAAADTVSEMMGLVTTSGQPAEQCSELARLMGHMAIAAVGRENVEQNQFYAVNEALLPILADRVSTLTVQDSDIELWRDAFSVDDATAISANEASKLNRFVHIADASDPATGRERGAIIALPSAYADEGFESNFGLVQEVASEKCFACKDYIAADSKFRWVLVQAEAACDFAQARPGPLPFYLGLEMPERSVKDRKQRPGSVWSSPVCELDGCERILCVNSRFHVSILVSVAKEIEPLYRLREQLLNELVYHIHVYEARPGVLSFRKS